jgi:hypothetical protein
MATKDLARTVVEGGRAGYSKWDRRRRNRSRRRLRFDENGDVLHGKPPTPGWRGFDDRLKPLRRWIGSHVGRGWNNVYRDFCTLVDRRTVKGWHLDDHLKGMVDRGNPRGCESFHVDARGILRRNARSKRERRTGYWDQLRAFDWARGRQILEHGGEAFWTADAVDDPIAASRQGPRLTESEMAFWKSLTEDLRHQLRYDAERRRQIRTIPAARRGNIR